MSAATLTRDERDALADAEALEHIAERERLDQISRLGPVLGDLDARHDDEDEDTPAAPAIADRTAWHWEPPEDDGFVSDRSVAYNGVLSAPLVVRLAWLGTAAPEDLGTAQRAGLAAFVARAHAATRRPVTRYEALAALLEARRSRPTDPDGETTERAALRLLAAS